MTNPARPAKAFQQLEESKASNPKHPFGAVLSRKDAVGVLDYVAALQARVAELEGGLRNMWFAYQNKDGDCPHSFEEEAVKQAEKLLGPWKIAMAALSSAPKGRDGE